MRDEYWIAVMGAMVAAIILAIAVLAHAETRRYFHVPPSQMARNYHTHVDTDGKVTISKHEGDGDWHIRITDGKGFVVAECIPELPCIHPRRGQCVTALRR